MRKSLPLRMVLFTLVVLAVAAMATPSSAEIRISVGFAPPPLPIYEQPLCPGDGYLWTPGYWGWDADFDDYYWIPGTWVLAPEPGFFWTPPYWGWADGAYAFYDGYWGPEVGFYGGVDYGFGYFGFGFVGGRWEGSHFFYNRAVLNVNVENIHNVYNENVDRRGGNHVSYNGGEGGINARPTPQEEAAARQRHVGPVAAQTEHMNAARGNPEMRASANHGKPAIAATARPGDFHGGAVAAREAGGTYTPHPSRGGAVAAGGTHGNHPNDLAPIERNTPNTGNAKQDKKYQKEQDKLIAKQNKERQKLQQKQDKEHAKAAKQASDAAKQQQMEQRHQQQTQQLEQRHVQQRQQLQQRYSPPAARGGRR